MGTIGAITAAILAFPVSGVFAAIMAGLLVYSAKVSFVNCVLTIADNCKAMSLNDTNPGLARYYGKTNNIWLNLLNTSITTVHDREFSLQTGLDVISYKIPAAGDLSKINSFPKYFGSSEFNPQLSW